jgi:hypothetical protein
VEYRKGCLGNFDPTLKRISKGAATTVIEGGWWQVT